MKYKFEAEIKSADHNGGAYIIFPYEIRKEFGKGRQKVKATFDGEIYYGSIVNMGLKNSDGSICYILGIKKDIREKISKTIGDKIIVTVAPII